MCFDHYIEAWAAEGQPAAGHSASLDNLRFVVQDVAEVVLTPHTAAVCIHACNEANLLVLRKCREVGAPYAVSAPAAAATLQSRWACSCFHWRRF